ncbi:HAD-IIA family hydrolase [Acidimicrobiaceae bacterium]|nr:HAD-IIA family hydrolase [Acidimicrobiaceae bacterium]
MKIIATDLDGTIYLQSKIIPGVKDSIHEAKKNNFRIIFITNNSSETPYQIKNKLENMLSNEIHLNDIVSPLVILKDYLKNFDKNIYVHGSYNLQKYVKTITTELFPIDKSEIILIGRTDSFSRHDVEIIADAFNRGVDVIAMNKDLTFPINDHEFKDGNGAIVREIENLVGSSISSFGKPDSFYSEYLLKQFPQIFAVIGDRVDTDIILAKDIDAKSYLVNSSIKNYLDEDIADFKFDTFSQSVSFIIKNSKN